MELLTKISNRIESMPDSAETHDEYEAKRKRWKRLKTLQNDAGRFFDCSLSNYVTSTPRQSKVAERLAGCINRIDEFVSTGVGLVLWGRIGTGKDHLACALLRAAASASYSARWVEGVSLYEKASRSWGDGNKANVLKQYISADCLVISDPVFLRNWSPAKSETLAKVVRGRYDKGRPTWITANAKDLKQLREMCVPDVYDRLTERAVIEHCDWSSYRQSKAVGF